MIYSNVQPHRRNATSLNPTFQTRAQQIAVTAETLVEVWNPTGGPEQQGAWEEVEESLVQRSLSSAPTSLSTRRRCRWSSRRPPAPSAR